MSAFGYRDGVLCVDEQRLDRLAEGYGTPLYVYDAAEIRRRYARLVAAFGAPAPLFCYALKANPTLGVVAVLAEAGAGADVVSAGELARAIKAGIAAERIVFAGVGKTREEIDAALDAGILQFNVESLEELAMIDAVAGERGTTAPVALRLNPDVAARTHDKIATGRRHDKFGIGSERLDEVLDLLAGLAHVRLEGLHCHIGSQIRAVADFACAYERMVDFWRHVRARGYRPQRLNLGGGLGIADSRADGGADELDLDAFAAMVRRVTVAVDATLVFEPGRFLVAAAGVLLARVTLVKTGSDGRRFAVLDAGMNNLVRPAMYGAVHDALPVRRRADAALVPVDLVGPICESSDVFERDAVLPPLAEGDLLAFTNAGAYGATMASDYNSKGMAAEVLVDGARIDLVKPRRSAHDLMADESVPGRRVAALASGP